MPKIYLCHPLCLVGLKTELVCVSAAGETTREVDLQTETEGSGRKGNGEMGTSGDFLGTNISRGMSCCHLITMACLKFENMPLQIMLRRARGPRSDGRELGWGRGI